MAGKWYKHKESDKVWWLDHDRLEIVFSFDKRNKYYLPRDYERLTPEQKEIFDAENAFWKEYLGGKE